MITIILLIVVIIFLIGNVILNYLYKKDRRLPFNDASKEIMESKIDLLNKKVEFLEKKIK